MNRTVRLSGVALALLIGAACGRQDTDANDQRSTSQTINDATTPGGAGTAGTDAAGGTAGGARGVPQGTTGNTGVVQSPGAVANAPTATYGHRHRVPDQGPERRHVPAGRGDEPHDEPGRAGHRQQ